MALTPYQRRVEAPATAQPQQIVDTRTPDVGAKIANLGAQLLATTEPIVKQQALDSAKKAAGEFMFTRNEEGNLVVPAAAEDGGVVYRQAFDQLVQQRYVNNVNMDFQNWINEEINNQRAMISGKPFDPMEFQSVVQAKVEGMLEGVDPNLRGVLEETLGREGLERTRSAWEEWGRTSRAGTIAGIMTQQRTYFQMIADGPSKGWSPEEISEQAFKPLLSNIARMRELAITGPEEFKAAMMQYDIEIGNVDNYFDSVEFIATTMLPVMSGMGEEDIQKVQLAISGVPFEGGLSGTIRHRGGNEEVTPTSLKGFFKDTFGFDPTSVDRSPTHSLSLKNPGSFHNTANGGRAIDTPRIEGMTFEQYVATWEEAGFTVLDPRDEYKNPSPHATGGHWHIALGALRTAETTSTSDAVAGITADQLNRLDPSMKKVLSGALNDRLGEIREDRRVAAREAAENVRAAAVAKQNQDIYDSITGAEIANITGNYDGKQRKVLEGSFAELVNFKKLSDPNEQQKIMGFVQKYNYVPEALVNFFDNGIRSENWQGALTLYRGLKQTTLTSGARVGDLLVTEIDPRTKALLSEADTLDKAGISPAQIGSRVESLRSGGPTFEEFKTSYNGQFDAGDKGRGYIKERNEQIVKAYGFRNAGQIPPALARTIDAAAAANFDIVNRDPIKALSRAMEQNQNIYTKNPIFMDGVGPGILTRTYTPVQIAKGLSNIQDANGNKVLKAIPGHKLTLGKNVLLVPTDDLTGRIGRYNVRVFHPVTGSILNEFPVDLGKAMQMWGVDYAMDMKPANPIGAAEEKRSAEQQFLLDMAQREQRRPRN